MSGDGINIPPEAVEAVYMAQVYEQSYTNTNDPAALDLAVAAWQRVLNDPTFLQWPRRNRLSLLHSASKVFMLRYSNSGRYEDLDIWISLCRQAIDSALYDQEDLAVCLSNLGIGLRNRFEQTECRPDLDEAITAYQRSLDLTTPNSPSLPLRYNNLGNGLRMRYNCTGRLEDLEQAIDLFTQAIACTPTDGTGLAARLANLGGSLLDRYDRLGQEIDLKTAIDALTKAVQRIPADHPQLPLMLTSLSSSLNARYQCAGNLGDLERAISISEQAINLAQTNSPQIPFLFQTLADGLMLYYTATGKSEDLDRAVQSLQQTIQLLRSDAPQLPRLLTSLAKSLHLRFAAAGQKADLDQALELARYAVDLSPAGSPHLPARLGTLAAILQDQFNYTGDPTSLDSAVYALQQAIELSPTGSRVLASSLANLSETLCSRYLVTGVALDLDRAIGGLRQAIEQAPEDAPELPTCKRKLAMALLTHYDLTGAVDDLDMAVALSEQALEKTSPKSPGYPEYLHYKAEALFGRYKKLGRNEDLDEALRLYRLAVEGTLSNALNISEFFNGLGTALQLRYKCTDCLEDLDAAIDIHRQAADRARTNSLLAECLSSLGNDLSLRYRVKHRVSDLDEAIKAHRRVIDLTPPGSPEMSGCLSNLGSVLRERAKLSEQPQDFEEAAQILQRSITGMPPPGSPHRSGVLRNLSNLLFTKYEHNHSLEDLDEAIRLCQQSIEAEPPESPEHPFGLHNMGRYLKERYVRLGHEADSSSATEAFEQACRAGLDTAPEIALHSGRSWGMWALKRSAWQEAARAYRYAIRAAEEIYRRQLALVSREAWMRVSKELASTSAYALARSGDLPGAVVALEGNRARLLADALARDRTDLARVKTLDAAIYTRYVDAVGRLRQLEGQDQLTDFGAREQTRLSPVVHSASLHHARAELDAALEQIRGLPGLNDFLKELTFDDVKAAVRADVPLVYIAVTEVGSCTLTVRHTEGSKLEDTIVEVLWSEQFDTAVLQQILDTWIQAYDNREHDWHHWLEVVNYVTAQLWINVMGSVTEYLLSHAVKQANLIPAGLLALLPLHASWRNEHHIRRYALDDIAFAYAPSARTLLYAQQLNESIATNHLLAVEEPQPVQASRLPETKAEVSSIAALFPRNNRLYGKQATKQAIINALPSSEVTHFACHGETNWQAPRQSGLLTANDELLTVEDLCQLHLNARLAVLSACETGIPGTDLPDEVVGLPAAFLQAGFAGVVASLWSVADRSTALLMVKFYSLWQKQGLEPIYALRAAQQWLRDTAEPISTNRTSPGTDKDLITSGDAQRDVRRSQQIRPSDYSHPFWWAAFYLTGL